MGDHDTDLLLPGWHDLNPVELLPRRPLVLNEPGTVWYIEAGSLSVSVSSARSGLPVGWRHRLFGGLHEEACSFPSTQIQSIRI
jgi:hypothetical protein